MSSVLLPGSTIGILGGGQLGRMLGIAARNLGYGVHVFEPMPGSPAGAVADLEVNEPYDNASALARFAQGVDVLTYEFENIPTLALQPLEQKTRLCPGRNVLHVAQNRRREKEFLRKHGIPVADFRIVERAGDLAEAAKAVGFPCVVKTADFGYDGRGQQKLGKIADVDGAWEKLGAACAVVEQWVSYQAELSVIVARRGDGVMKCFPITRNVHEHHILAVSEVPALFDPGVEAQAQELAQKIAQALEVVGLLAVEMFLTNDGKLLVNELAPRPHNSGHWTLDSCVTSQFEQHVRAVCNLPLGDTTILKPTRMRNVLGDVWEKGTPAWNRLLELPGLHLHLYGKKEARPGRKMGHYNVVAESLDQARALDEQAQTLLKVKGSML